MFFSLAHREPVHGRPRHFPLALWRTLETEGRPEWDDQKITENVDGKGFFLLLLLVDVGLCVCVWHSVLYYSEGFFFFLSLGLWESYTFPYRRTEECQASETCLIHYFFERKKKRKKEGSSWAGFLSYSLFFTIWFFLSFGSSPLTVPRKCLMYLLHYSFTFVMCISHQSDQRIGMW